MLRTSFFALSIVALLASAGLAQVIYEPVQYQYGQQEKYYYGGTDWRVFARAQRDGCQRVYGREVYQRPVRIYNDCIANWNAAIFGYTMNDAYNNAYQSVPTYFRKGDLFRDAEAQMDGTIVVPARPMTSRGTIEIKPYVRPLVRPTTLPQPLMIIPKQLLEPKAEPKKVVAAE